jgi:hypothetical protein
MSSPTTNQQIQTVLDMFSPEQILALRNLVIPQSSVLVEEVVINGHKYHQDSNGILYWGETQPEDASPTVDLVAIEAKKQRDAVAKKQREEEIQVKKTKSLKTRTEKYNRLLATADVATKKALKAKVEAETYRQKWGIEVYQCDVVECALADPTPPYTALMVNEHEPEPIVASVEPIVASVEPVVASVEPVEPVVASVRTRRLQPSKRQTNPQHNMELWFTHGQQIRHGPPSYTTTWIGTYNATNKTIECDGQVFHSPSGFSTAHAIYDKPNIMNPGCNGWRYCETLKNGIWTSIYCGEGRKVSSRTHQEEQELEDEFIEVEDIEIDGVEYYLDTNTNDVYDTETNEVIGKYMDGQLVKVEE